MTINCLKINKHLNLAARRIPAHIGGVERLGGGDALVAHLIDRGVVGDFLTRERTVIEPDRIEASIVVVSRLRTAADGGGRETGDPGDCAGLQLLVADAAGLADAVFVELRRRIGAAAHRAVYDGEVVGRAGAVQAGNGIAVFVVRMVEPELTYGVVPEHSVHGVAGRKRHTAPGLSVAVLGLDCQVLARLAGRRAGITTRLEKSFTPVRIAIERKVEIALEVLPNFSGRIKCTGADIVDGVPVIHEPVLDVGGRGHRGSWRSVDCKSIGDDTPVRADTGHYCLARPDCVIVLIGDRIVDTLLQERGTSEVGHDERRLERGARIELVGNPRDGNVRLVRTRGENSGAGIPEEGGCHEIPKSDSFTANRNEIADKFAVLPDLEGVDSQLGLFPAGAGAEDADRVGPGVGQSHGLGDGVAAKVHVEVV